MQVKNIKQTTAEKAKIFIFEQSCTKTTVQSRTRNVTFSM